MYKLHIRSWSKWRSFMRSVCCLIVYSNAVHIFLFTSSAISSVWHKKSNRRWATWYTFRKNIQRLPVFVGFERSPAAGDVVSKSAVEIMICCFADPGDITVKPPPLTSFWGLVPDKRDCPGRIGEPKTFRFVYHIGLFRTRLTLTEEYICNKIKLLKAKNS